MEYTLMPYEFRVLLSFMGFKQNAKGECSVERVTDSLPLLQNKDLRGSPFSKKHGDSYKLAGLSQGKISEAKRKLLSIGLLIEINHSRSQGRTAELPLCQFNPTKKNFRYVVKEFILNGYGYLLFVNPTLRHYPTFIDVFADFGNIITPCPYADEEIAEKDGLHKTGRKIRLISRYFYEDSSTNAIRIRDDIPDELPISPQEQALGKEELERALIHYDIFERWILDPSGAKKYLDELKRYTKDSFTLGTVVKLNSLSDLLQKKPCLDKIGPNVIPNTLREKIIERITGELSVFDLIQVKNYVDYKKKVDGSGKPKPQMGYWLTEPSTPKIPGKSFFRDSEYLNKNEEVLYDD